MLTLGFFSPFRFDHFVRAISRCYQRILAVTTRFQLFLPPTFLCAPFQCSLALQFTGRCCCSRSSSARIKCNWTQYVTRCGVLFSYVRVCAADQRIYFNHFVQADRIDSDPNAQSNTRIRAQRSRLCLTLIGYCTYSITCFEIENSNCSLKRNGKHTAKKNATRRRRNSSKCVLYCVFVCVCVRQLNAEYYRKQQQTIVLLD